MLDFGLAKALEPTGSPSAIGLSMSPTFMAGATQAGVIMGTAPYMAPEQARGKAVDRRTDIWAFGCVVYEMLTGTRAFPGDGVTDALAKILEREPDWRLLPPDTPTAIRTTLARCLQKDPSRRFHHIADTRLALEDAPAGVVSPDASRAHRRTLWLTVAGAAAAGAVVAALLVRATTGESAALQPMRLFTLPEAGFNTVAQTAISRDGKWLAFAPPVSTSPFHLYARSFDSMDSREIATSLSSSINPLFSPDSRWVAYFTESGLYKAPIAGGAPERVADVISPGVETGAWGLDGTIVLNGARIDGVVHSGLAAVSSSGGIARKLTVPQREESHHDPEILPDGKTVLFTVATPQTTSIAAVPITGGAYRIIVANARTPKYAEIGQLLFQRSESGEIVAVPFDAGRAEITGDAMTIGNAARVVDAAGFAISQEGTLIYSGPADTNVESDFTLVSVDRSGAPTPLMEQHGGWTQPRVSPDGRLVVMRAVANPNCDLWVLDLERGTRTRLTLEADNHDPIWHPNGREVTWGAESDGPRLLRMGRVDGTGQPRPLADGTNGRFPESWSPDGRFLAFSDLDPKTDADIWVLPVDTGKAVPFLASRFREQQAAFSRDGRWLAYTSNESGREEIYMQPYNGNGGRVQISSNGGTGPVWARNGRELFYTEGSQMMAVDIELAGEQPKVSRPHMLFQGPYVWERARNYDVMPDGGFVMVQRSKDSVLSATLRVTLNWPTLLGRR